MCRASLSMSEDSLLSQFCNITNTSDASLARSILEDSKWNLNDAIANYFEKHNAPTPQQNQDISLLSWLYEYIESFFYFIASFFPCFVKSNFNEYFHNNYGQTCLSFFPGDFSEASNHAATTKKPLVIYLHFENGEYTAEFCKSILCNENIGDILFGDYVFWAQKVDSPEGRRVRHYCGATNYPFICIYAFDRNEPVKIDSIQGRITLDSFKQFAKKALKKVYEGDFGQSKLIIDRMIRREQDSELEEAMKRDSIRLQEQRNREKERLDKDQRDSLFLEKFRSRDFSKIDAVKLNVRMPDGSSLKEVFNSTDTIEYVKQWLSASHLIYPERKDKVLSNFTLHLPYGTDSLDKMDATLKDIGLVPNGTLLAKIRNDL